MTPEERQQAFMRGLELLSRQYGVVIMAFRSDIQYANGQIEPQVGWKPALIGDWQPPLPPEQPEAKK